MSTATQRPTTTLQWAEHFFSDAIAKGKNCVTNVDLQHFVIERTRQSRDVVHGTLDCTGPGTLIDAAWYTDNWHKETLSNGRVLHQRNTGAVDITLQRELNFDYPNKHRSSERIMFWLPATGRPRLLTLASAAGTCVQAAVARNPRVQIHNVECRPDVLRLWQAKKKLLGVKTTDHFGTLQEFMDAPGFAKTHYHLINADAMGYAGKRMHGYLGSIIRANNTDVVAITTQHMINGFRNSGTFADSLRKKYAHCAEPQVQCIEDWMPGYDLIDWYTYKKRVGNAAMMEVLVFMRSEITPEKLPPLPAHLQ
jgi:hypothetical protein